MPASAATTAPRTFWSDAALAAAVDAAFAEALAEELAAALADDTPDSTGIVPLDTETLIRQAGVVTGPCPPDPRVPSPAAQRLKHTTRIGGRLAAQAAWWLLRTTALLTVTAAVGILRLSWHIIANPKPAPQPQLAPITPSGFLAATSRYITDHGWTQHVLADDRGVCLREAENALIRGGTGTRSTARQANAHLRHVTGALTIPTFNDWLTRREDQIHAALLTAAARARAAGE
ncbi:hypothetical protein GCM10017744_102720 [Streptomyces antimycoticus]|uniref:Uncharacterized protein n=1 Tax=Streptomyces antimycoticus TaxID=68175 RepID=A0A4D4KQX0_9ACTN|nr:hypothetical protein [Streptomyces antimycoticus]GDY49306.1 hypothetical protein SANT12839_101880 [Streptomyces antimycoticus]